MADAAPLTNWAGNVTFGAARVHRPGTIAELQRIVAQSRRVRALGSAHSFSRVADTTGDLVQLGLLPRTVDVDPESGTATVAAHMRYVDVAVELHRQGYALGNLASLPHISVAGSLATATHGSGDRNRCLAAAVTGLRLVGAGGDLVELRRGGPGGPFAGSVVALGALGVVTHATLEVEPAYEMEQRVFVDAGLDEVAGRVDDVFGAAYSVSVFTDWAGGRASVWLKSRTGAPRPGWMPGRPADRPLHPVPGMPPEFSTQQLGVPGPCHERLPHFRPELMPGAGDELQSEYFLPRERAAAACAALRGIAGLVAPVLHVAELRTVRGDGLWLSPAYGRDSFTFHFTWIRDEAAVWPVIGAVEELLIPLGARPHWGKLTGLAPPELAALYERAADFGRLAGEHDPGGKFRNPFLDALLDDV